MKIFPAWLQVCDRKDCDRSIDNQRGDLKPKRQIFFSKLQNKNKRRKDNIMPALEFSVLLAQ